MAKEHQDKLDEERVFISNTSNKTLVVKLYSRDGFEVITVPPHQEVTIVGNRVKEIGTVE